MSRMSESTNMSRWHATHKHSNKKQKKQNNFVSSSQNEVILLLWPQRKRRGVAMALLTFQHLRGALGLKCRKSFVAVFQKKKQQQDVELIKLSINLTKHSGSGTFLCASCMLSQSWESLQQTPHTLSAGYWRWMDGWTDLCSCPLPVEITFFLCVCESKTSTCGKVFSTLR